MAIHPAVAVRTPHRQDTVGPSLENRGQAKPPKRKLPDHEVAPLQFLKFLLQIRCKAADFGSECLLCLRFEIIRVLDAGKIVAPRHRVELHGVQLGRFYLMSCLTEEFLRLMEQSAVEAAR